jgi:hypothetical protein
MLLAHKVQTVLILFLVQLHRLVVVVVVALLVA